jgi:hypothetical protein
MKIQFSLDTTELVEAIAERYPHAGLSLSEIHTILEGSFTDILTNDREYDWHLKHDRYFNRLEKECRDRQQDAEEAMAQEQIAVYAEDQRRFLRNAIAVAA